MDEMSFVLLFILAERAVERETAQWLGGTLVKPCVPRMVNTAMVEL